MSDLQDLIQRLHKPDRTVLLMLADVPAWDISTHFYTRGIVEHTGLSRPQAKRAARRLVNMGLAELSALFDEYEGTLAGRGYGCTPTGREVAKALRARPA